MSIQGKEIGGIEVTPQLVASLFWGMASDEHADFFEELEEIAGYRLCMQMASVVAELAERAAKGKINGSTAFNTMLAHSQDYAVQANEWRAFKANLEIDNIVRNARKSV